MIRYSYILCYQQYSAGWYYTNSNCISWLWNGQILEIETGPDSPWKLSREQLVENRYKVQISALGEWQSNAPFVFFGLPFGLTNRVTVSGNTIVVDSFLLPYGPPNRNEIELSQSADGFRAAWKSADGSKYVSEIACSSKSGLITPRHCQLFSSAETNRPLMSISYANWVHTTAPSLCGFVSNEIARGKLVIISTNGVKLRLKEQNLVSPDYVPTRNNKYQIIIASFTLLTLIFIWLVYKKAIK